MIKVMSIINYHMCSLVHPPKEITMLILNILKKKSILQCNTRNDMKLLEVHVIYYHTLVF